MLKNKLSNIQAFCTKALINVQMAFKNFPTRSTVTANQILKRVAMKNDTSYTFTIGLYIFFTLNIFRNISNRSRGIGLVKISAICFLFVT